MVSAFFVKAQINITDCESSIEGKLVTAYNTGSQTFTNTAFNDYHLSYFAGMQCIGDIDKDGIDDYAVTSWKESNSTADRTTSSDNGIAYIFFGSTNLTQWYSQNIPVEEKADLVLVINNSDHFGWYVSALGDVNADGISDFAIMESGNASPGAVYVFFGKANRAAWHTTDATSTFIEYNTLHSGSLTSTYGLPITTSPNTYKYKYKYMKDEGNVKGMSDYIFNGRSSSQDNFGRTVASAGDVDGDGVGDIIIGAPGWTNNTIAKRGKVYVIRGMSKGTGGNGVNWGTTKSIIIDGNTTVPYMSYSSIDQTGDNPGYEMLGYGVAGVGDMNKDGRDDICFGGDNSDNSSGNASISYTISGTTYKTLANEVSSYRLSRAYLVFGSSSFFTDWNNATTPLKDTKTTASTYIDVTFISSYIVETSGSDLIRWSGGLGTIISKGGNLAFPTGAPTQKVNTMLLSEPFYDHGFSNNRSNNYGIAYIFFAKQTWASTYNLGYSLIQDQTTWNYASLVNYGTLPNSITSRTLSPYGTGFGLRNLGDINGDGFDDIAISSHYDHNQNPKGVTLLYGGLSQSAYENGNQIIDVKTIIDNTTAPLAAKLKYIVGETYSQDDGNGGTFTATGLCFASKPGDINGDGKKDLVLSDYTVPSGTISKVGKCYINLQCAVSGEDLYGQDDINDAGQEPNLEGWVFNSPDIWNRVDVQSTFSSPNSSPTILSISNTDDFKHQNPDPKASATNGDFKNHAIIRIHNRGCSASATGVWKVNVYWTLASTGEKWPNDWNALSTNKSNLHNCTLNSDADQFLGGLIGSFTLSTSISSGGTLIIDFPWTPPAPDRYKQKSFNEDCLRLDACLIARIVYVGTNDNASSIESNTVTGLTKGEVAANGTNVRQNNNIFTKNLMIVDLPGNGQVEKEGTLGDLRFGNSQPFSINSRIKVMRDVNFNGTSLYNIGNSYFTIGLPTDLYNIWVSNGSNGQNISDLSTLDSNGFHLIKIDSNEAIIDSLPIIEGGEFIAPLGYHIDNEYTVPEDFFFEQGIIVQHECDINDSNYETDYKEDYIETFGTRWEVLGGISYQIKVY